MNIKIDSLIPFDTLRTDLEQVFSVVEKNGKVILLSCMLQNSQMNI